MKTVFVLLLGLLLSGCTGWQTLQSGIAVEGARMADEALQSAEWGVCEAATVGSWKRKYGQDPHKAAAWRVMCSKTMRETPSLIEVPAATKMLIIEEPTNAIHQ